MRLICYYTFMIVSMLQVELSFQNEEIQHTNNAIMNSINTLEASLETTLSSFLEDKMANVIEKKLAYFFEHKTLYLLEDQMAYILDNKFKHLESKMRNLEDWMSILLLEFREVKNTIGDAQESSEEIKETVEILFEEEFKSAFNKTYENEAEAKKRLSTFKDNYVAMETHNKLFESGQSSYLMGVNEFSDMTYEEVIDKMTGIEVSELPELPQRRKREADNSIGYYTPKNIGEEPDSLDYRVKGAINPIRNQRHCGSCWAFAITSSIESHIFLNHGELLQLSEQDLVDCAKPYGPNGCDGGHYYGAIEYVKDKGIAFRDEYSYIVKDGTCNNVAPKTSYKVTGMKFVIPKRDTDLLNALVHMGPISITMYISDKFQNYKKGVLVDDTCTEDSVPNHGMVLMGYGRENGLDYWLIRNSWGDSWGENGYIKLARHLENHCMISASGGYIPVIEETHDDPPGANYSCTDEDMHTLGRPHEEEVFCIPRKSVNGIEMEVKETWVGAQAVCRQVGGFLAEPSHVLETRNYFSQKLTYPGFWLGGSDREQEGIWRWSSNGAMVGYRKAPNYADGEEDCLFMVNDGMAPLKAGRCVEEHNFICEMKAA